MNTGHETQAGLLARVFEEGWELFKIGLMMAGIALFVLIIMLGIFVGIPYGLVYSVLSLLSSFGVI